MSWTDSLEVAERFCEPNLSRLAVLYGIDASEPHEVWTCEVPAFAILTFTDARNEREFIVDVSMLPQPVRVSERK
jgi:hypothetical protein